MKKMIRISIRKCIFFIRTADCKRVFKSFFHFEVKVYITEKNIFDEEGNYVGKEVI